ncbi:MAG: FAD-dependent oxidoreductase, partial [Oscillospiraceae bacterium]
MQQYDVIVIGAGNGGLASAATLAEKGKRVILFEKHNIPGGCGTSFRRGRFEFEVALHQLSSMGTPEKPGPLREQFRRYGIEDKIDWI